MTVVYNSSQNGDRGSARATQNFYQQYEEMTWLRPQIRNGCGELPTVATGGLQGRAISGNGLSTADTTITINLLSLNNFLLLDAYLPNSNVSSIFIIYSNVGEFGHFKGR